MMDLLENAGNVNLPAKRNRTDGKPPTKKHKS